MAGAPRAIVLLGPAGTGKTTVGMQLAPAIAARFVDADDAHTPASVEKMRRGEALTDADRAPWLDRVRALSLEALDAGETVVVACSALRQTYRERLAQNDPRFVLFISTFRLTSSHAGCQSDPVTLPGPPC